MDKFRENVDEVKKFREAIRSVLVRGEDYGSPFPGSNKESLLKPGAEKIISALELHDTYEEIASNVDPDKGFYSFRIRCKLYDNDGNFVTEGVGECNSFESKYRYRRAEKTCPTCGKAAIIKGKVEYGGGWVCYKAKGGCNAKFDDKDESIISQPDKAINEDTADVVNTIYKMAAKRRPGRLCYSRW